MVEKIQGDIVNANSRLVDTRRDAEKAASQIGSLVVTLRSNDDKQRRVDTEQANALILDKQAILEKNLREKAENYIKSGLSEIEATDKGNRESIGLLKNMTSDITGDLSLIDKNLTRLTSIQKNRESEYEMKISALSGGIAKLRNDMEKSFGDMFGQLEGRMDEKRVYLKMTESEMEKSLEKMKYQIAENGNRLKKNLQLYQAKIDGVVSTIRAYMNTSATADEMAIRHGISNELSAINKTEIQSAKMRSGIVKKLSTVKNGQQMHANSSVEILKTLVESAKSVVDSRSSEEEAQHKNLLSIGSAVDIGANGLRKLMSTADVEIGDSIVKSEYDTKQRLETTEGRQAKRYSQIALKSKDVDAKSRNEFINQLQKMDSLNDDVFLTSKQLSALLGNANASIADISTSVIDHMDLNVATRARLNDSTYRKIASVGDVMAIFSSLLSDFINEISSSMKSVMMDMDETSVMGSRRLWEMRTRSEDEIHWLSGQINKTRDAFLLNVEHDRAEQEGLMKQLVDSSQKLAELRSSHKHEVDGLMDEILRMKSGIELNRNKQILHVKNWIENRRRQRQY